MSPEAKHDGDRSENSLETDVKITLTNVTFTTKRSVKQRQFILEKTLISIFPLLKIHYFDQIDEINLAQLYNSQCSKNSLF